MLHLTLRHLTQTLPKSDNEIIKYLHGHAGPDTCPPANDARVTAYDVRAGARLMTRDVTPCS